MSAVSCVALLTHILSDAIPMPPISHGQLFGGVAVGGAGHILSRVGNSPVLLGVPPARTPAENPFPAYSSLGCTLNETATFTDGLVETRSPSGELFGNERLREALCGQAGTPASALVPALVSTLQAFGRQTEPHDDLTIGL